MFRAWFSECSWCGCSTGPAARTADAQAAEQGDADKVDKRRKRKKAEAQDAAFIEEDNDGDYQASSRASASVLASVPWQAIAGADAAPSHVHSSQGCVMMMMIITRSSCPCDAAACPVQSFQRHRLADSSACACRRSPPARRARRAASGSQPRTRTPGRSTPDQKSLPQRPQHPCRRRKTWACTQVPSMQGQSATAHHSQL